MSYVFCCPRCRVERPAASSVRGRRVRCPDCFELVEATQDGEGRLSASDESKTDTVVYTEREAAPLQEGFDPYEHWLGIPIDQQPVNFYRLLDLPLFEPDSYVISGAADRQIAKIQAIPDQAMRPARQKLIDEIQRAKICLTDAEQKPAYDRRLQKQFRRQAKLQATGQPVAQMPQADLADENRASEAARDPSKSSQPATAPRQPAGRKTQGAADEDTVDEFEATRVDADDKENSAGAAPTVEPTAAAPKITPPPVVAPQAESPSRVRDTLAQATSTPAGEGDAPAEASESPLVDFSGKRIRFEPEMDMTPMVDVTFLLLIFFMVTASFTLQKSKEQPVQKQDKPSTNVTMEQFEDNPEFVVVQIDESDSFRVITAEFDEEAPSEQELLTMLRRSRQSGSGQTPTKLLVAAHGNSSHGRVIMAMDAGTEVGMEQVQFTLAADGE